jgi:hypothetical protein
MRSIEESEYQYVSGSGDYGDDDPPPAVDSDWMPGTPYIVAPRPIQHPPMPYPYSNP